MGARRITRILKGPAKPRAKTVNAMAKRVVRRKSK